MTIRRIISSIPLRYLIFAAGLLFSGCSNGNRNSSPVQSTVVDTVFVTDYKEVSINDFSFNEDNVCSLEHIEIIDLYQRLDSIADDRYERILIAEK